MSRCIYLGQILMMLGLVACTTNIETSTAYSASASSQSIPIGGYTTEPSGWVYPQVLTSLNVAARDSSATWLSLAAVQASSTPINSGGDSYYVWQTPLTNFTDASWPPGGVARVRILYEYGSTYTTGFTFDDLDCLLDNSHLDFEDRAIACVGHDSGYIHLVDRDPISSSSIDYISLRETPAVPFLGSLIDPAADYYAEVDPLLQRTNLADWQAVNGFTGLGGSLPGYDPVVSASYYNSGDLELGRDMNCVKRKTDDALACYVTNYGDPASPAPGPGDKAKPSLDATINHTADALVATVAMEYRPGALANQVTFFAFGPNGQRVNAVELDSEGAKQIPGACLSCHGGRFNSATDSVNGAHFLPFDLDNFKFSTAFGYRRAQQEDAFRALNELVLIADPTPAITELVNGWYNSNLGARGPDQNSDYVPPGWNGHETVYLKAIKPYCRGCHVALQDAAAAPAAIDMTTYAQFDLYNLAAMNRVCERHDMPHAEVTRNNFWQSPARGHLIGEFQWPTACD